MNAKPELSSAEVEKFFNDYKEYYSDPDITTNHTPEYQCHRISVIVIQQYLFKVPLNRINEDASDLLKFSDSFLKDDEMIREWENYQIEELPKIEGAVILVNSLIRKWNKLNKTNVSTKPL